LNDSDDKGKHKKLGRLSNLTKVERIGVYVLPFAVIFNVINAFDLFSQSAGTTGASVSAGMDFIAAFILAGLWLYLFSGRSLTALSRDKKKNKDK